MRKKIKLLEYHSNLLTVSVNVNLRICNISSFKEDLTACRNLQKIQGSQESRFTGTGRTNDGYYFSLTDICCYSIENLICTKSFLQILYLDQYILIAHWFLISFPVYSSPM